MSEWQDIKEAKGNQRVIVFDIEKGVIPDAYIFDNDGTAYYGFHKNKAYNVTHFMPLPSPPTEKDKNA